MKLWKSIKRNPVLNVFILTAFGQFLHDYLAGAVDWDNITVYVATLAMGVIARMFVVPENEHYEKMSRLKQTNSDLAAAAIKEAQEG